MTYTAFPGGENESPMVIDKRGELDQAVDNLVKTLGAERVVKFSSLLDGVLKETGYGSVAVTVRDYRIELIVCAVSHK
jgi:hypothetical protein